MSEDYKYLDDTSREENSRDNSTFYDNVESDEMEEENGDPSKSKLPNLNADKLVGMIYSFIRLVNAPICILFNSINFFSIQVFQIPQIRTLSIWWLIILHLSQHQIKIPL